MKNQKKCIRLQNSFTLFIMKLFSTLLAFFFLTNCTSQETNQIEIDGIKVTTNDSISITKIETKEVKDTFEYFTILDTNYQLYSLPKAFEKPQKWKNVDSANQEREFYGNDYPEHYALQDVLSLIDTTTSLFDVYAAKSWCLQNYEEAFPHLISRLSVKKKIGLKHTADLIIWDRIGTGDLKFYGHGGGMQEDIFTIAGRASWILNEITGEDFAVVHGNLTKKQAKEFKNNWIDYIEELKE